MVHDVRALACLPTLPHSSAPFAHSLCLLGSHPIASHTMRTNVGHPQFIESITTLIVVIGFAIFICWKTCKKETRTGLSYRVRIMIWCAQLLPAFAFMVAYAAFQLTILFHVSQLFTILVPLSVEVSRIPYLIKKVMLINV
jgi:hypothetical protein